MFSLSPLKFLFDKEDDDDWTPHYLLFRTIKLVDGKVAKGPQLLMRRRVDGKHEYRLATENEVDDYAKAEAW